MQEQQFKKIQNIFKALKETYDAKESTFKDIRELLAPGSGTFQESSNLENDKVNYRDNYLAFYFGEQRLRIMSEIAREVYGECRVKSPVVKGHVLPENFNKNTSLSEYLGSDGSNLKCEIFLAPGYDDSDAGGQY